MRIDAVPRTCRILTILAIALSVGLFVVPSTIAQDSVYSAGLFELGDAEPPPGFPGMGDVLLNEGQPGPDWAALFNDDGSWRDSDGDGVPDFQQLFGGRSAVFAADDVSLGTGFESTALAPDGRVKNGVAAADHDLGNAYVYSTTSSAGNLVIFAGAERLGAGASHLEFEFNQNHFRLGHGGYGRGEPWKIDGERAEGDVLIKVTFTGGALGTIEASSWDGQGWVVVSTSSGEGCDLDENLCAVCNSQVIDGGPWVNYDTGSDPEMISVSRFIEVGVNVGALLGSQPTYTTVRLRTPQDTAFGYFAEGN